MTNMLPSPGQGIIYSAIEYPGLQGKDFPYIVHEERETFLSLGSIQSSCFFIIFLIYHFKKEDV